MKETLRRPPLSVLKDTHSEAKAEGQRKRVCLPLQVMACHVKDKVLCCSRMAECLSLGFLLGVLIIVSWVSAFSVPYFYSWAPYES